MLTTHKYSFTIFTPIYNRCKVIHRVWESLNKQTYKNFEWIVVDDGSQDEIQDILFKYKNIATFPMSIIQQVNSGKHVAWNNAIKQAKGELFVPADSDDRFIDNTLDFFISKWNEIDINERNEFSGINVLCKNSTNGNIIGNLFPADGFISNNLDLVFKYKIEGEKWGCIRTDVLRKRPFPNVKGSYFSENYIWLYLARKYNVKCFNEPLRVYYPPDNIALSSKSSIIKKYFVGSLTKLEYFKWHLRVNNDYIRKYQNILKTAKDYLKFLYLVFKHKKLLRYELKGFNSSNQIFLILLTIAPAFILSHIIFKVDK